MASRAMVTVGCVAEWPASDFASPKSMTLIVPAGRQLDVGGLEIAVDEALLVRGLERIHDLAGDADDVHECQAHRAA